MMAPDLIELIPKVLAAQKLACLDLTGGAPELTRSFAGLCPLLVLWA